MALFDRFRETADHATREGTPPNEKATCDWVILPVLREVLGYGVTEVVPEDSGPVGNRPDYTILPNTDHTWFLEAKAWSVGLTDQHAVQATTYAHQTGKRWVILTNGHDWRLYDLNLPGQPAEKVAVAASADDPENMETLLAALTRDNVVQGGLEAAARLGLLRMTLATQLTEQDSKVVRAIWTAVRKQPGLGAVGRGEVAQVVAGIMAPRPATEPIPPSVTPPAVADATRGPATSPPGKPIAITDPDLSPTGTSPALLTLPDGSDVAVRAWWRLFEQAVTWLAENAPCPLPVPWKGSPDSKKWLWINTEPTRADDSPMLSPVQIQTRGGPVYLETHASSASLVSALKRLCSKVGVDPAQIRVTLK